MWRLTFVIWSALFLATAAEAFDGKVVSVHDGDTITVLDTANAQHKIRFAKIDAPELKQDFGRASKDVLSALVFGKIVAVEPVKIDNYGREVADVFVNGRDVGLAQVQAGMAWVYRKYSNDPAYLEAEEKARGGKAGLWSRPDAVPPWEFRHGGRASSRPATPSAKPAGAECGTKQYCGQMSGCAEAMHYLNDCGLDRLDRDGDGVPCESLCAHQ